MKITLITFLVFILSIQCGYSQTFNRASIGINVLPEVSIVDKDLLQNEKILSNQVKVGYGIGLEVNGQFWNNFQLSAGLNLIHRKFESIGSLNQSKIPLPYRSFTREYVAIKKLTYRSIELPVKVGYAFINLEQSTYSFYVGGSANFILSGDYQNSYGNYDGVFDRIGINGYSGLVGVQATYTLDKDLTFTYGFEYSIYNTIGEDDYISNNGQYAIAVNHNFARMIFGIQKQL